MSGKRSRIQNGYAGSNNTGRGKYRVTCDPDYGEFEVYYVNVGVDPPREVRAYYATLRVYENGDRETIPHTVESLNAGFQKQLRKVGAWGRMFHGKNEEGNWIDQWILVVREREIEEEPKQDEPEEPAEEEVEELAENLF